MRAPAPLLAVVVATLAAWPPAALQPSNRLLAPALAAGHASIAGRPALAVAARAHGVTALAQGSPSPSPGPDSGKTPLLPLLGMAVAALLLAGFSMRFVLRRLRDEPPPPPPRGGPWWQQPPPTGRPDDGYD